MAMALELFPSEAHKIFKSIYEPENPLFINPMWSHTIIRNRKSRSSRNRQQKEDFCGLKNCKKSGMIYGMPFFGKQIFSLWVWNWRIIFFASHNLFVTYEPNLFIQTFCAALDLLSFLCDDLQKFAQFSSKLRIKFAKTPTTFFWMWR